MRITNSFFKNSLLNNLQASEKNLEEAQRRVASGKRIEKMSDDSIGATRIMNMRSSLKDLSQYETNIEDSTAWLNLNESLFTQAGTLVSSAKTFASQAASETMTEEMRKSTVSEVSSIKEALLSIANTKYEGKYVFSGFKTGTKAFGTDYSYAGDDNQIVRSIGPGGLNVTVNFNGNDVFQGTVDIFNVLQDLEDGLNNNDTTKINAQIDKLTTAHNQVLQYRSTAGSRLQMIEMAKTQVSDTKGIVEDYLSNEEDVDLVQATLDLKTAQNVYEAALSAGAGIFQYSLVNFLK